jgi:hypothetical protein
MLNKSIRFIVCIGAAALFGCAANTGVVKISDDTYLLGKQGGWETSGSVVKVGLYKEANQFCSDQGKKFVQTSAQSEDQGPGKHATAEIQFKCN